MYERTENRRYRIQVLRGLAITAVVLIHHTPIGTAQIWCRPLLNFCVGLFLFLSGMLSDAKAWNPQKRIIKIAIPYILWTLVYVLLAQYKSPGLIPIEYIKNLLTARSAAVMYFVFVYCELTLLIPLIDKLAHSKFRWIGFIISPLEIIIMRLIPLSTGLVINKYVHLLMEVSCLGWFTYFYMGYLIGNEIIKIDWKKSFLLSAWLLSLALQVCEGYWYYTMGETNCGTQLKLSSVLSGLLFALIAYKYIDCNRIPAPGFLHLLGRFSFGIFFSHIAIMTVLSHISLYERHSVFPLTALIVITISVILISIGRQILGDKARYLAL